MILAKHYQIEAASSRDDLRPTLKTVNITTYQDKPVAVAADGMIMAVVPIIMQDDDVPGLVPNSHFTAARKVITRVHQDLLLRLSVETTTDITGTIRKRSVEGHYPNFWRVVPNVTRESMQTWAEARRPIVSITNYSGIWQKLWATRI